MEHRGREHLEAIGIQEVLVEAVNCYRRWPTKRREIVEAALMASESEFISVYHVLLGRLQGYGDHVDISPFLAAHGISVFCAIGLEHQQNLEVAEAVLFTFREVLHLVAAGHGGSVTLTACCGAMKEFGGTMLLKNWSEMRVFRGRESEGLNELLNKIMRSRLAPEDCEAAERRSKHLGPSDIQREAAVCMLLEHKMQERERMAKVRMQRLVRAVEMSRAARGREVSMCTLELDSAVSAAQQLIEEGGLSKELGTELTRELETARVVLKVSKAQKREQLCIDEDAPCVPKCTDEVLPSEQVDGSSALATENCGAWNQAREGQVEKDSTVAPAPAEHEVDPSPALLAENDREAKTCKREQQRKRRAELARRKAEEADRLAAEEQRLERSRLLRSHPKLWQSPESVELEVVGEEIDLDGESVLKLRAPVKHDTSQSSGIRASDQGNSPIWIETLEEWVDRQEEERQAHLDITESNSLALALEMSLNEQ
eukprot:TRINITY_DN30321_c0_g1_i1.p1 TRINITY_DN30321_c0_g1~~TRINITY_DN30321_c0_g1_i1.p1  ORF type:complete len:486 (+),score=78.55 TRINITY_DN30321_c0_g1_i1:1152-2609(+)